MIAVETIETRRSTRWIAPARHSAEAARATNYPLARWYLRPLAGWLAARLVDTAVRPWHISLCGFACAVAAVAVLIGQPALSPYAALLAMGWWFCDRADGLLARLQGTASPLGAWLDGNLDELVDLGLHLAMAHAAAIQGARWAWPLLIAFFFGKYLLMHGLVVNSLRELTDQPKDSPFPSTLKALPRSLGRRQLAERVDYLYHLPGNADVRAHLMILALATGCFTAELAVIAVYYNLRWMIRYPLQIFRAGRQPA